MAAISRASKDRKRSKKQERLVARISREDKALIVHAAALMGQSVGSFIVAEGRRSALRTIESRERILLNATESRRFVEALLAPSRPPTQRMKRALKRYQQTVVSQI